MDNNRLIENRNLLPGMELYDKRQALIEERITELLARAGKEDIVYIIGHKRPDADSVFSSYLLANVLGSLGINAKYAIREKNYDVLESEQKLVHDYLQYEPVIVSDDNKFILVDHNNLEGLSADNVIGCIDHHIITGEVSNLIEVEYTSTGLLIYDLFKKIHQFSDEEKILIGLTVLTDSEYLCSSRFTDQDRALYDELEIDLDVPTLQKKYFQITNFDGDITKIVNSNYKEYNYNGENIKRTMIYSYNKEFELYFNQYHEYAIKNGLLLIWANYEDKKTYIVYGDKEITLDYILTSTNLILKMLLEKQKVM